MCAPNQRDGELGLTHTGSDDAALVPKLHSERLLLISPPWRKHRPAARREHRELQSQV